MAFRDHCDEYPDFDAMLCIEIFEHYLRSPFDSIFGRRAPYLFAQSTGTYFSEKLMPCVSNVVVVGREVPSKLDQGGTGGRERNTGTDRDSTGHVGLLSSTIEYSGTCTSTCTVRGPIPVLVSSTIEYCTSKVPGTTVLELVSKQTRQIPSPHRPSRPSESRIHVRHVDALKKDP